MLVKLLDILNEYNLNNEGLTVLAPTMSLKDDLGLDSLDIASLVLSVEIELGFDADSNNDVETVGDIVKIIEDLTNNGKDPLIGSPFHN